MAPNQVAAANDHESPEMSDSNDTIREHKYWIAAFIDLLGQERLMQEIDFVPKQGDEGQMARFIDGVKKVYGSVAL